MLRVFVFSVFLSSLLFSCSSSNTAEEEVKKEEEVKSTIVTYENIKFGQNGGLATHGRFFSFDTGRMYKDSEVDEAVGPKIHLAFSGLGYTMFFFSSPDHKDFSIPNASNTKVTNSSENSAITIEAFDAMKSDEVLGKLEVVHDNESFGKSGLPCTILFELSTGQRGVIKAKSVTNDYLLADIKIQAKKEE